MRAWASVGADLVVPVLLQEVSGHVAGQDVPQHVLVVFPQLLHLVDLLLGLDAPQEVEPRRVLQLRRRESPCYTQVPDRKRRWRFCDYIWVVNALGRPESAQRELGQDETKRDEEC